MQTFQTRNRGHDAQAPGFGQTQDPFAILGERDQDDDDGINFDDTYDGLGEQLDEADDVLNDDTFGDEPATQANVGRDYDFSGRTARVAGAFQEEHMVYTAGQPARTASLVASEKPSKTGYEKYTEPVHIPQLEANASLWGISKKSDQGTNAEKRQSVTLTSSGKKVMSLEEVEAAMRAERKKAPQTAPAHEQLPTRPDIYHQDATGIMSAVHNNLQSAHKDTNLFNNQIADPRPQTEGFMSAHGVPIHQASQHHKPHRQDQQHGAPGIPSNVPQQPYQYSQPPQILQNPNRISASGQQLQAQASQINTGSLHRRGPSIPGQMYPDKNAIAHMSEEERHALLVEEAKRVKRNHKIFLLSKDNGLMTPYDKNFISRIQLQQLVTSTGSLNDQRNESALTEDFYYQVYSQIRSSHRQTPQQPMNQFAQTYLLQTSNRHGPTARKLHRAGDTHMQRMEQQVQRAVEFAKQRPKNKQLVIEGSLGKISFSNAKTPKPLLNIKRPEGTEPRPHVGRTPTSRADKKVVLRDLENVYDTLMKLEDHERNKQVFGPGADPNEMAAQDAEWQQRLESLNQRLWQVLKVMAPIVPNSPTPHPFIAILSHTKGKRAIPRIYRHLSAEQRLRILTITVLHLDALDVVQRAVPSATTHPNNTNTNITEPLPRLVRESIDLFSQTVLPSILAPITDEHVHIVIGLLGLLLDRVQVPIVLRTKIGLSILTMLVSRAELAKQGKNTNTNNTTTTSGATNSSNDSNANSNSQQSLWDQWAQLYDRLFNTAEPFLPVIFPGKANEADDVHVWQFLATMAVGASPEQQQRLVIGVKERIMETVSVSKTLLPEMEAARLGHVNLFMRAIGLDVDLLG